jgi:archaemetzincin
MKLFICLLLVGMLAFSCGQQTAKIDFGRLQHAGVVPLVVLQPLSYNSKLLSALKDSIPTYYPVAVTLADAVSLPASAWYTPRQRFKADSLLPFLLARKPQNARVIAGITDKDISIKKGTNPDYGVMGLGLQPGDACVISIFRLQKGSPSSSLLFQRLLKTVLHEIGHNFGLPHCPNRHCIMADAEGGLNQDNETGLCEACKKKLGLQ